MNIDLQWLDAFWEAVQSGGVQEWRRWNYIVLFVLIAVEGPIATLLGAAAASAGFMRLSVVILVATVANLIADIGWYSLGWLGLRRRHLDKLRWAMRRHARKVLLIAKFSTGFAIPALVAAGLSKIPLRRWVSRCLCGWRRLVHLSGADRLLCHPGHQTGASRATSDGADRAGRSLCAGSRSGAPGSALHPLLCREDRRQQLPSPGRRRDAPDSQFGGLIL
jgi:hypothetical protein